MTTESLTLAAILLLVATAYAAVGQAGATGYLAVMGLAGLQPSVMKPTALALNILVAAIGTIQSASLRRRANPYDCAAMLPGWEDELGSLAGKLSSTDPSMIRSSYARARRRAPRRSQAR